jgi:hypothetical protein
MRIDKGNIAECTVSGEFDIAASVKSDKDSKESKQVTLRFKLLNIPVSLIVASSLKDKRINWQVGARTKFNQIIDHSIITVDYSGGRTPVDIEEAYAARLAAMTPEAREAAIKQLLAKSKGK